MDPFDLSAGTPQAAAILQQRAAMLARPPLATQDGLTQVLECAVAGQAVAIELSCLREVRSHRPYARLPLANTFVLGVISLQGRMLPVLDLGQILGLAAVAAPPRHLIVLGRDRSCFGVPAGDIYGVRAISLADAGRRGLSLDDGRAELVKGVTPEGRLVLDSDRLLAFLPAG